MGKKVFYLKKSGVRKELLKSPEMEKLISQATFRTTNAACQMSGKAYKCMVSKGSQRIWGVIYAADRKAKMDNQKNNTLLKALGGTKV